jgi:hypothetical protein
MPACRDKIQVLKGIKDATRKLLDLIYIFSKAAGYNINIQKSITFICTNTKHAEKEIRKTHSH